MPREYTSTLCPLCTVNVGRLDALVRHIARKHNDVSIYPARTEAGVLYEPVAPGSQIVFCQDKKGIGCCLKCSHPLHVSGFCKDRRAFFAAHVCKEKQVRDYGLGPGKGRKGSASVPAAPCPVRKEVVTKTVTERIITLPEEMEETLRSNPKYGHLFRKPEPTPKENEDDWTDEEEEELPIGEILNKELLNRLRFEAALNKSTTAAAAAALAAEQRDEAKDMTIRELQMQLAESQNRLHNLARDTSELNKEKQELITLVETHAPEPIVKAVRRRNNGYQNIHQPLPSHV